MIFGVGSIRMEYLLSRYGNARAAYEALAARNGSYLKGKERERFEKLPLAAAEREMIFCEDNGISVITRDGPLYPRQLLEISAPPLLLYVLGETALLNSDRLLTIIGTRKPTQQSIDTTLLLGEQLARDGVIIVSGLAVGIDKTAHDAALSAGAPTIGVAAAGLCVDYPRGSMAFRRHIAQSGGAVISECPLYSRYPPGGFTLRNRILSGLSRGVLIMEAGEASGCCITANHAIEQNREVFCIAPPNIFDPRYDGVKPYLRDGAIAVFDSGDVIEAMFGVRQNEPKPPKVKPSRQTQSEAPESSAGNGETAASVLPKEKASKAADKKALLSTMFASLTEEERKLAALIAERGAAAADELSELLEVDADELSDRIISLEMDGVIERGDDGKYVISEQA
jgi:DNA processing protein